jgi:hypothetical protein
VDHWKESVSKEFGQVDWQGIEVTGVRVSDGHSGAVIASENLHSLQVVMQIIL